MLINQDSGQVWFKPSYSYFILSFENPLGRLLLMFATIKSAIPLIKPIVLSSLKIHFLENAV